MTGELSDAEIEEMSKKELRRKLPSGWMELSRYETLAFILDTLLEEPPNREFTASELADKAGPTRQSVNNRIGDLVNLGVVTELPNREGTRYRLNQYSPIVSKLHELNTTVERVKNGSLPKTVSPPSKDHTHEGNIRGFGGSLTSSRTGIPEIENAN